jgi:hypothetical protein
MNLEGIATIAYSVTGILSLLYIARQVALARNQAKGQFLLALDERLEKSTELTMRLFNDQNFAPSGQEWGEVWLLMNTYERVNIMIEDKILELDIVERAYGFRVVALIQNDAIYLRIMEMGAEWEDFISLCKKLAKYYSDDDRSRGNAQFCERVKRLDRNFEKIANPWKF